MNYPSVRIEGAILSPDILGQIEDMPGQRAAEFALNSGAKVKDEIARAWADAQAYWRVFQRKLEAAKEGSNATSETRNLWMVPFLGLLRYEIEYQPRGTELDGRNYPISHRAVNRSNASVHIIGARDRFGLDKKPDNATRRMSAHALLQEFLNLHDQLYGIVTNGLVLRLLRDSSRLVKQSYLEFDLDRIFTDGLYADFAVLYRLLHATRLPMSDEATAECWIERYHQDSLDSGARIREGLSVAVEQALLKFGNGFLSHPGNDILREAVASGELSAINFYQQLLRLIYRLLFLMVIEERDLIFPPNAGRSNRDIYQKFYSIDRLRRLSENRYLADPRRHDLWLALQALFRLFEADGPGTKLGIQPLAGDLFSPEALRSLTGCELGNDALLGCLRSLGLYRHPDSHQVIRVNYAALNVEEFGSVYEGLLEYKPQFVSDGVAWAFEFRQGDERAISGSHYTPDDLVQPLIRHSLDHLIAESLNADDREKALLDLRVVDIACGSGHILLAAARRIATKLALVRTGEEQPSPTAYRAALRDAIRHCIYGVDMNPLAVELCKVALWLEAHIPGQPLNFLDHHIKCGNAIVGFARREDLDQGVPIEAFKTLRGDDKKTASGYRSKNKAELNNQTQDSFDFTAGVRGQVDAVVQEWRSLSGLPENSPDQIDAKKERFTAFAQGDHTSLLRTIADIPVAQFFIPKVPGNKGRLVTDSEFRGYLLGQRTPKGAGAKAARSTGETKRFFHWFLEFPEVMERGGFDCILGNPPYLGGQALSGTYGHSFCECMKWRFAPAGLSDLVVYFLRRIHELLRDDGFASIITTNSIIDGSIRNDGLDQLVAAGCVINMAVRGIRWPGTANLVVSLLSFRKGEWTGLKMLDDQPAEAINTFFEEGETASEPQVLSENQKKVFQGSIYLGEGFLLTHDEAERMKASDPRNVDVIMPIINGKELNNKPDQVPDRSIINFHDWPIERARGYPEAYERVRMMVKPVRDKNNMRSRRENWWRFGALAAGLYDNIQDLSRCFATAGTSKHLNFSAVPTDIVFTQTTYVFATDRWDLYTVVQSTLHELWVHKYGGSLKQDPRYSSTIFNTFPFPAGLWQTENPSLAELGEYYHARRKALMNSLWLGLTKTYNLFHAPGLSADMVAKISKKEGGTASAGLESLLELRHLHVELDLAVRDAYGWKDLELEYDFHEVQTLPENDRVRYTISATARREVLKRLLATNLERAESRVALL